jgi:predicted phosphodiesterase
LPEQSLTPALQKNDKKSLIISGHCHLPSRQAFRSLIFVKPPKKGISVIDIFTDAD